MKKFIYLLMVLGLVFTTSCDPMDEIYADIDAQENIVVGDAIITLTDEDYTELGLDGGFESVDDVKSMLPAFLTDLYPVWGDGSSAIVNYTMVNGLSDLGSVSNFINASTYRLENTDYPGYAQNAFAFFPDEDPLDVLEDILEGEEGDIVLVRYNQYVNEPVTGIVNYFEATFNGSLEGFETINVVGTHEWEARSRNDDEYAQMSGFSWPNAFANEDWLISPEIDLTTQTNLTFQINQLINFASGQLQLLNVYVATNYTGDQTTATWDLIDFQTAPTGDSWDFVLSEEYNFSAYEGETIHIAFKYESTNSVASTWRINDVVIKTPGVEGETVFKEVYYMYSGGEWEDVNGVYYLLSDDYDSMGESSGQPGRFNNFSNSTAPSNYLPAFLNLKYPFAQEEDELIVMYKYFISGTGTRVRGNVYTVTNGDWVSHSPSLQFGHDGVSWVPDNTIKYTLTAADFDLVGNGRFGNFDVREGRDEETVEARLAKINTILLNNFPGMDEGQKFTVTYDVWTGAREVWQMKVVLSGGVYILQ